MANDGKTQASKDESTNKSPLPAPTLPKGGGAIRSVGEKFSANPATGAGSFSVPVFTSAGRGGFHPELTLQYDSGKGNGPFGIGWSLSVPRITRKTDKGLPRYIDGALQDSDTFILSGAEDLVPVLDTVGGEWARSPVPANDDAGEPCSVQRYRPRVDSLYARIERWTRLSDGEVHWQSFTKDNIRSIYGQSATARVADPADPSRVFSWLLEETRDGKGNIMAYGYVPEDQNNLDTTVGIERPRAVANAYLKTISYGNQTASVAGDWLFQVLFDYGELNTADPLSPTTVLWPGRPDPFSDFRSTFEVRTYRLCQRILMLHNFTVELGTGWTVVRSTDLRYTPSPVACSLRCITQTGWIRDAGGSYTRLPLPSIDLHYSQPVIEPELHTVDPTSTANLPMGIDGKSYRLLDLDGDGLPGILTQQAGALFYKRSNGNGQFGAMQRLAAKPSTTNLGGGFQQLTDIDGSGNKFIVQLGQQPQGYSERRGETWAPFRPFRSLPNLPWGTAALKYVDLDGDGLPDILKPEGELFRWWGSLGRDGYGAERRAYQPRDERQAPYVVWNDPRQAVLLADMTGDGLSDVVRVTNGSVSYWPNLGYGRFGAQVIMRNAPLFTNADQFNPDYLRLADIDGSGTADLMYLASGVARVWLNQAGNGYSAEQRVPFPSPANNSVTVTDFLGKGTACLVWSSPLPGNRGTQLRYLDLMSGIKPHLLVSVSNNLGATTTISYAPSTTFYLADRAAGLPWITKLPFPVQVVSSIEIDDAVTGTKIVTTYRYHHGHYDGIEREFAGFGMVEQQDAETLQEGSASAIVYTPPKLTKTWFHTGAFFDAETVSQQYAKEYSVDFPELVPDSVITTSFVGVPITPEQAREAARALRGHTLRQETYGLDGTALASHPYFVTESNYAVRWLQPRSDNRYGAFDVIPRETLTAHTERNPADPRSEHDVTLTVDELGNVTEAVHIGYARKSAVLPNPQAQTLVTDVQHDYVSLTDSEDYYRVGLVRQSRTYELTGLAAPSAATYSFSDVVAFTQLIANSPSSEIDFSVTAPPSTPAWRLVENTKMVYLGDDTATEALQALGLVVDTQHAALTQTLAANVYQALVPSTTTVEQILTANGYIFDGTLWWAPTGQTSYAAASFYLPVGFTDPFGNTSSLTYDHYSLLPITALTATNSSAYATSVSVQNDYRVLQPMLITDTNKNQTQAQFDALGRVEFTWVMGNAGQNVGDDADHPSTSIAYITTAIPAYVIVTKREQHWNTDRLNLKTQIAYSYTDGLGREVLTKKQAQPDATGAARWTGTGRVAFDNKGNPVQKFEPYFSATPSYENVVNGVSDLLHYDPLGRVVRTDHPNGSYSTAAFGELTQSGTQWILTVNAWGQVTSDENDTLGDLDQAGNLINAWYNAFKNGTPDQQDAATKAFANKLTPTRTHVDPLGRTYITEQDNGFDTAGTAQLFSTTLTLDIQGNQRLVTDARQVQVAQTTFDMLKHPLVVNSVDAGIKTQLFDAVGAAASEWTPTGYQIDRDYDALRRPLRVCSTLNGGAKQLVERTFYGELITEPAANLRGHVFAQLDGAGLLQHTAYDFKGNLLSSVRQLATSYDPTNLAWTDIADSAVTTALAPVGVDMAESFVTTMAYDALNRVTSLQVPSSTGGPDHVGTPTYNQTGLLDTMSVQFVGTTGVTPFITGIDYNEKEQRLAINYGNGVVTTYSYEPDTFRLSTIQTASTPTTSPPDLQSLSYTYDPVGNITTIEDAAQQTLFVGNSKISPQASYTYDAIYRLISAFGREQIAQSAPDQTMTPASVPLPHPNDSQAMRLYQEQYSYDQVGNFAAMNHAIKLTSGAWQSLWTRTYKTDSASNRLLQTVLGNGATTTTNYIYDLAGNIVVMPPGVTAPSNPQATLDWDYRNQLIHAKVSQGDAYFQYDDAGQRVRKTLVTTGANGLIKERFYLGAYEVYRERTAANGIQLERRTLDVHDGKRRIALAELVVTGNDGSPAQLIRYQLDNHLGSAVLEIDQSAQTISYEEYHPYGTTAYRAGESSLGTNPKRYAFTGKERDEETGVYYSGARYYAPWIGRWMSPDPAGLKDDLNEYAYAHLNPIRFRDPDGMQNVDANFQPSVEEGLRAYGMSAQTYAIETANRTQRTAAPAAVAAIETEKLNETAPRQSSIGPARTGVWEKAKQFVRGALGSDAGPPSATRPAVLKTRTSIELVQVPNAGYGEQLDHYLTSSEQKTPLATRAGAGTAKFLATIATVVTLAYSAGVVGRIAGASADPAIVAAPTGSGGGGPPSVSDLKNQLFLKGEAIAGKQGQDLALARAEEALTRFHAGELQVPEGLTRADLLQYRDAAVRAIQKAAGKPAGPGATAVQNARIKLIDEIIGSGKL